MSLSGGFGCLYWLHQWGLALSLLWIYKESTFGLCRFYWLHQGRIPHRMCRFHWLLAGRYKVGCVLLGLSFRLHQGRIPRHTCRFYCCLAAHQRTRKKDSAEPSFPILWTPPHPPGGCPLRRGITAAAGLYQFRYLYSGASRLSPVPNLYSYLCSALYRSRFSRFCWADVVRFSLLGGWSFVPAATCGFGYILS